MAVASWEVDLAEVVDPLENLQNVEGVAAGVVAGIVAVAAAGAADADADEDHHSPSYLRIEADPRFQLYGFKIQSSVYRNVKKPATTNSELL